MRYNVKTNFHLGHVASFILYTAHITNYILIAISSLVFFLFMYTNHCNGDAQTGKYKTLYFFKQENFGIYIILRFTVSAALLVQDFVHIHKKGHCGCYVNNNLPLVRNL